MFTHIYWSLNLYQRKNSCEFIYITFRSERKLMLYFCLAKIDCLKPRSKEFYGQAPGRVLTSSISAAKDVSKCNIEVSKYMDMILKYVIDNSLSFYYDIISNTYI